MEEITQIVESVLKRENVDPSKDLFEQGVTSLAYVRIITQINQQYQLSLNGSEVDGIATIERLAKVVEDARTAVPSNG